MNEEHICYHQQQFRQLLLQIFDVYRSMLLDVLEEDGIPIEERNTLDHEFMNKLSKKNQIKILIHGKVLIETSAPAWEYLNEHMSEVYMRLISGLCKLVESYDVNEILNEID